MLQVERFVLSVLCAYLLNFLCMFHLVAKIIYFTFMIFTFLNSMELRYAEKLIFDLFFLNFFLHFFYHMYLTNANYLWSECIFWFIYLCLLGISLWMLIAGYFRPCFHTFKILLLKLTYLLFILYNLCNSINKNRPMAMKPQQNLFSSPSLFCCPWVI